MRTYRRLKLLADGASSPANKGVLIAITSATTTITFTCLDAVGNQVSFDLVFGVGNAVFPVYVQKWTKKSGGTATVYELN